MFEGLEGRALLASITPLDFIPDAINNSGHVIGSTRSTSSYVDGYPAYSVFWTPTGGDQKLNFNATGLNDSDKVIGDQLLVSTAGGVYGVQTAVWTPSGGNQLLPNFPVNYQVSINNNDDVTGEDVPQIFGANIYAIDNLDTGKVGIPPFSQNIHFVQFPMNNAGDYAGYLDPDSQGGTSGFVASLANPGQVITTLQGSLSGPADQLDGNINAINDSNQVVGEVANQAVIWNGGILTNLGFLDPGDTSSSAEDINDSGVVVGYSTSGAFAWSKATGMIDLNTLLPANSGWSLEQATGINDQGQIVGNGYYDGNFQGFVINDAASTVVPGSVTWDRAKGTVDFSYTNVGIMTQAPQITFAWSSTPTLTAQSTRIAGTIFAGQATTGVTLKGSRPGSDFAANPPPAGTKYLLVLDTLGSTTTVGWVAYAPTITVTDTDGATAGMPAGVFGRFFNGALNADDTFHVSVSDDLSVMTSTTGGVTMQINGVYQALTPISQDGPGYYTTSPINTGAYTPPSAPLTVTASGTGGGTLASAADFLYVLATPTWLSSLTGGSLVYSEGQYYVATKLLDVDTSTFLPFALPSTAGWLGTAATLAGVPTSLETGVEATLNVGVIASTNPLVKPPLEIVAGGGSVTYLGTTLVNLPTTVIQLVLDPRTLNFTVPTINFVNAGTGSASLFGGQTFTLAPLNIQANLTATVNYGVNLMVTINPDGTINASGSSLQFWTNATVQGDLTFASFSTGNATLDAAFSKLQTAISIAAGSSPVQLIKNLLSTIGSILTDLGLPVPQLLPTISASAGVLGSVTLNGAVALGGTLPSPKLGHGFLSGNVNLKAQQAKITFTYNKQSETASTGLNGFLDLPNVPIATTF